MAPNHLKFDPHTLQFAPVQLIEASAGTGKTYSITSLYLRFILEQELPVEKILVLSFTEAATAELRERLRNRLQAGLAAFRRGGDPEDPFLDAVVKERGDPGRALLLLQKALGEIDQAAVITIHSFCQRMLQQEAFACGLPFELELVADIAPQLDEIVRDYLATIYHRDDPRLLSLLRPFGLAQWRQVAAVAASHRYFPVVAGGDSAAPAQAAACTEIAELTAAARIAFTRAHQQWQAEAANIRACLEQAGFTADWRRKFQGGLLDRLAAYLAAPEPDSFVVPAGSEQLRPEKFSDPPAKLCTKTAIKKALLPQHQFFVLWGEFLVALKSLADCYRQKIIKDLIALARRELPARLYSVGRQSFDDLLYGLEQALRGPGQQALATFIANRYPVALIDEFQDTDPVQYAIFQAVYGNRGSHLPAATPKQLILIGDPKQAIYSFRGADIFAYLRAARDAEGERYTMAVNWRADCSMVAAVNALFNGVRSPFVVPEIDFPEVVPGPKAGDCWRGGLQGGKGALQFLTLPPVLAEQLNSSRGGPQRPRSKVEEVVPDLVAADIVRLLQGGARLVKPEKSGGTGDQGGILRPPDIAVLVRTNYQAEQMQAALRRRQIKAVIHSRASVFQSPEARQLSVLLHGLPAQAGEARRRAAMLTELLAATPADLLHLEEDENKWQEWLEAFNRWRALWQERGFMAMMRAIGEEKQLAARLLPELDGERRLTNYRHLLELLHQQEREGHLRATALLKWLDENITGERRGGEADELRLESDEEAVRVLTVHRSKGLEFPVVYCPYLWKTWKKKNDSGEELFTYHDPAAGREGKIALLPDDRQQHWRQDEQFAEELRLLYVALTRAKHCCLVVWENASGYQDSALAYLLHGAEPETLAALAQLSQEEVLARLQQRVVQEATWEIRRLPEPEEVGSWRGAVEPAGTPGSGTAGCRVMQRGIGHAWRVGSFSQLAAARSPEGRDYEAGRDYDAARGPAKQPLLPERPESGIMAGQVPLAEFPAGLAAGNLIHRIFELLSFPEPDKLQEIITSQTAAFGLGEGNQESLVLQRMVAAVLRTPLTSVEPFCLADITDQQRLNEMAFTFPVRQQGGPLEAARLAAAFAAHSRHLPPGYPEQLRQLQFAALQGYLKGFVDLIFRRQERWYIIDYKSNLLGPTYADYRPEALARPMADHHYLLQYHIYSVALHRHLAARMPGYDYRRHFGGVFYLFLRGMHPELGPAAGIFHDRPPVALIETLSQEVFA